MQKALFTTQWATVDGEKVPIIFLEGHAGQVSTNQPGGDALPPDPNAVNVLIFAETAVIDSLAANPEYYLQWEETI